MSLIEKKHEYLICLDSDGTVMDTMTIKHVECFGPAFIKVFNIPEHHQEIIDHWAEYNLYTINRGVNRFLGLEEIIDFSKKFGYEIYGEKEFDDWVQNTKRYSIEAIKEVYNPEDSKSALNKAIEWSMEVNAMVKALPMAKPFDGVCEIIKYLSNYADLVGVSSATKEAVYDEWKSVGIFDYFKLIACQDFGKKGDIIRQLIDCGYDRDKIIMLGDAMGDKSAADKNGVLFYPILPKQENQSWELFIDDASKKYFDGTYKGGYQESLEKKFFEILK